MAIFVGISGPFWTFFYGHNHEVNHRYPLILNFEPVFWGQKIFFIKLNCRPTGAGDSAHHRHDQAQPVQHPDAAPEDYDLDDHFQAEVAGGPLQAQGGPEGGVPGGVGAQHRGPGDDDEEQDPKHLEEDTSGRLLSQLRSTNVMPRLELRIQTHLLQAI